MLVYQRVQMGDFSTFFDDQWIVMSILRPARGWDPGKGLPASAKSRGIQTRSVDEQHLY